MMAQSFLLINCFNKSDDVKEKLMEISNIKEVKPVMGAYDYVVKFEDMSKTKLQKLIRNEIRPIENIRSTLTLNTKHQN